MILDEPEPPRLARAVAMAGALGLPLYLTGVLTCNPQLCLAGAMVSGVAVLLHVVLLLLGW